MKPFTRRPCSRGIVLVTLLVSTATILTVIGLAIDTAYLQLTKIRAQTAADAAAVGGVSERKNSGSATVTSAARADAAANGFTHGVDGVTVSVNNPPASGYYTTDNNAVEAIVKKNAKVMFLSLLGFQTVGVTARAVARLGAGTNCIYVLDGSASAALSVSGGVTVVTSCGIKVESNSSTAISVVGGSTLNTPTAAVVGSYTIGGGSYIVPRLPLTHVDPEPDPLASLTPPAVGACTQTNYNFGNGKTGSIVPGVYCNGIAVNGGAHLTLAAGTYILKGGGLNISNGAVVSGTDVTFYVTGGGGYSYGPVILNGGTTVTFTAPTSGSLAGILFFSDRSFTTGAESSFSNGTNAILNGTLYFPVTSVSYMGGANSVYTILVVKRLSFSGGVTVNNNYTSLPTGPPVKGNASLGE